VCDVWQAWPVQSRCAAALINVFAPRNATEFRRVLRDDGRLVVLTPRPEHLVELRRLVGALRVDPAKQERLTDTLGGEFEVANREHIARTLTLEPDALRDLIGMGPTSHHLQSQGRAERVAELDRPVEVSLSVDLSILRPR
ncbi:MAG: rRNA (guanine-N1)-methyltransferase, partial [Sciscionella sp.]